MTPSNRKTLFKLSKVGNLVLLYISLLAAYSLVAHASPHRLLSLLWAPRPILTCMATFVLGLAWHLSLEQAGMYRSHRLKRLAHELSDATVGCALSSMFTLGFLVSVHNEPHRDLRPAMLTAAAFAVISISMFTVFLVTRRLITRRLRRRGYNLRHVVLIGTNRRATEFAAELSQNAEWGYDVLGYVDEQWWNSETAEEHRSQLLGDFDAFPDLLRTMPIDEVIIALPIASHYRQVDRMLQSCKQHGIMVRSVGTFFNVKSSFTPLEIGPVGTITLHDTSWNAWGALIKRGIDILLSSALLLLLLPLLLLVALLIKLSSPGPVFFVQTRLGLGKRPFAIYKFRTMVVDAEKQMGKLAHLNETQGPTFKLKNDPRITRIGNLLRKTSLDEIPQLINVLIGDMSLVGPRPLPLRDYEGFSQDWHRRRFSVKPGITCLWQVMGRSSITFEQWMALDIRYIDQWSIWLDFKIMAQTIPAVLRGSGAV